MATSDDHPSGPDWTLRPGVVLHAHLEECPVDLAVFTAAGIGEDTLAGLIGGTVRVDRAIAEKLGRALGTSARFWLNSQDIYDRDIARGARDVSRECLDD